MALEAIPHLSKIGSLGPLFSSHKLSQTDPHFPQKWQGMGLKVCSFFFSGRV